MVINNPWLNQNPTIFLPVYCLHSETVQHLPIRHTFSYDYKLENFNEWYDTLARLGTLVTVARLGINLNKSE